MKNINAFIKAQPMTFSCIGLLFFSLTQVAQCNWNGSTTEQVTFFRHLSDAGKARGVTVEEIADGGYILTGYTNAGENGGEDVLLIKTDAHGETIWRKTYGGKGNDHGWALRQTQDRGYIIVGYTQSFGQGGTDIYLIKTDSEGDTTWTRTYGGKGDEFGWDIRITKDNGFIISAQTNSLGNGEIDAYLIKVDAAGNEQWSKTYGGKQIDRIFSVQQTQDGGFVAAGITYSYSSTGPNDRDGYLLKTNASGNQEWYTTFGGDAYDVAHSVALTNDGGYIITGYGESDALFGKRDLYLIKTNATGTIEWT